MVYSVAAATRNLICEMLCVERVMGYALMFRELRRYLETVLKQKYNLWQVGKQTTLLTRSGVLEKIPETRKRVYYKLAKPLDYRVIEKAHIQVRVDDDTLIARYNVTMTIRNTGRHHLYYIGTMIKGNTSRSVENLKLRVYMQEPEKRPLRYMIYNDLQYIRQIVIMPHRPLKPGEVMTYTLSYEWDFVSNYIEYAECTTTKQILYELYYDPTIDYEFEVREFEKDPMKFERVTDRGKLYPPRRLRGGRALVKWEGPGPQPFYYQRFLRRVPVPGIPY